MRQPREEFVQLEASSVQHTGEWFDFSFFRSVFFFPRRHFFHRTSRRGIFENPEHQWHHAHCQPRFRSSSLSVCLVFSSLSVFPEFDFPQSNLSSFLLSTTTTTRGRSPSTPANRLKRNHRNSTNRKSCPRSISPFQKKRTRFLTKRHSGTGRCRSRTCTCTCTRASD